MTSLHTLIQTLDDWMQADSFKDYAPNGLQVEGREDVHKVALGVTASADVIEQAIAWDADALLVHHGYFWKNEASTLTGMKGPSFQSESTPHFSKNIHDGREAHLHPKRSPAQSHPLTPLHRARPYERPRAPQPANHWVHSL